MQVGQKRVTDERRFQKRYRVRELSPGDQFSFRIVTGPIHRFFHMWPTMVEDDETKVQQATWRSAHVQGDVRTVLDQLANVDKVLKQKHISSRGGDPTEAMSVLRKQDRYDYAIIPRIQGEDPEVSVLEANWTVYNDIRNLSTQKHPTKQGMLMYGLHYMYDLVLTKGRNVKTKRPSYKVDVLSCQTEGRIPMDHLDDKKFPIENPSQFFSGEDLAMIEAATWEIEEIDKPIENEKLIEYLKDFPIDLGRQDKKNASVFLFFNNQEDLLAIQNYAVSSALPISVPNPATMSNVSTAPGNPAGAPAALPPGKAVTPPKQPVETESQVVDDGKPPFDTGGAPVAEEVAVTRPNQPQAATAQAPVQTPPTPGPSQPANVPDAAAGQPGGLKKPRLW